MKKRETVETFFKRHMMHCDEVDPLVHVQSFIHHMKSGLQGKTSSLAMLPTYVELNASLPKNENVIVLDAGGTNLRSALIHFNTQGQPVIDNFRTTHMPGSKGEISCDEFFDSIVDEIQDIAEKTDKIGFCFSYTTQAMPNHDGKLLFFSKGIQAKGHENMLVGEGLRAALARKGFKKDYKIIIVNDTVTTLLVGIAATAKTPNKFDDYIGVILGTGVNTAYAEKNESITKISGMKYGVRQIINVESGNFSGYLHGSIDREFDKTVAPLGKQSFEKTMSGAYLGPLTGHVLRAMCRENVFSHVMSSRLSPINTNLLTKDIGQFLYYPLNPTHILGKIACEVMKEDSKSGEEDVEAMYLTCELMVERAAKFLAVNIASVILQSNRGHSPLKPVCVVIDGTTFYATKGLKSSTEYYLHQILRQEKRRYFEIIRVDNASLLGAAVAALTTFKS